MNKAFSFAGVLCFCLALCGCAPDSLDTSHLKKLNSQNESKNAPLIYEASTVKEALKAIPFKITLPKKLPFKTNGFLRPVIQDMNQEGKNISVKFTAFNSKGDKKVFIDANNFDAHYKSNSSVKVKLSKGAAAQYSGGNSLTFKKDDIIYNIALNDPDLTDQQRKKTLINLANQMFN